MAGITRVERERRDRLYERGLKECTACGRAKEIAEFGPRRDGYQGLYGECRKCVTARNLAYQVRNPDKTATRIRRWQRDNPDRAHTIAKRYRDKHLVSL